MQTEKNEQFTIKEFVDQLRKDIAHNKIKLPTLPNISLEALVVVNDDSSRVGDVAEVVAKDTAIATRLIKYANSPIYRSVNPVTTIKGAITRIGFEKVKNAILTLAMKEVYTTNNKTLQQRMERLWEHSMDVGSRCAIIAKEFKHLDQEEALLAGLIHDIGAIPILLKAADYEILTNSEANLDKIISPLHSAIGRDMLKVWKFDPRMVQVAAEHENLQRDPGDQPVDYVDIVQVANIMSYEGTDHPLTRVDRSKIAAFRRVNYQPPVEEQEQEDTVRDLEQLKDVLI
jgi:HD-like signal output (HDOD) protein